MIAGQTPLGMRSTELVASHFTLSGAGFGEIRFGIRAVFNLML